MENNNSAKHDNSVVYILPGGAGSGKVQWYQWLRQELKKKGYRQVAVCSQNRISPLERAKMLKKYYTLDQSPVVIGHSFGGLTALKWIELANQKIAGLALIDTSMKSVFEKPSVKYLKTLSTDAKRKKEDESRIAYLKSWNWSMNLKKVKSLVSKKVIMGEIEIAKLFTGWEKGQMVYAKALGAKLIWVKCKKIHFTSTKEPEVLKAAEKLLEK